MNRLGLVNIKPLLNYHSTAQQLNVRLSFFRITLSAIFVFSASVLSTIVCIAQADAPKADYIKVITERSAKIINTLGITDSVKYNHVLNVVVNQYAQLNTTHEASKSAIADIRKSSLTKEEQAAAIKKQEESLSSQLTQLHEAFIAHVKADVSGEQLEKIKDGMTYRVLPVTWTAYMDMLLHLTEEQKTQMYTWLVEARELAMDAESSEKKHAIFGKYKGRINNYLSAAGYDMKKEGEDWQKRIKAREAAKKDSTGG